LTDGLKVPIGVRVVLVNAHLARVGAVQDSPRYVAQNLHAGYNLLALKPACCTIDFVFRERLTICGRPTGCPGTP
jgi:hypothetical protein